jgi:nucleoside-diphosphate-sugar epimerase
VNLFITGGAGYCGSVLVPRLLERGHIITVYDALYFGNYLPKDHPRLTIIEGDIRDVAKLAGAVRGHEASVHLACISNDASFELDEKLSTTINFDAFEPMVLAAKAVGIRRFIYASSSSVYGVSDAPAVTEDCPLVPLTLYNKYKAMCEPLLLKHVDVDFTGVIFRPATVCGPSPRQRLDLSVNILTNHAVNNGKITVFGGAQMRPNLHIIDYCRVVELLLDAPAKFIQGQTFNVGEANLSIADIAELVAAIVKADIVAEPSADDKRSYRIDSSKIRNLLGFRPIYTVGDAIRSLKSALLNGLLPNSLTDDRYFNVRRLKNLRAL